MPSLTGLPASCGCFIDMCGMEAGSVRTEGAQAVMI